MHRLGTEEGDLSQLVERLKSETEHDVLQAVLFSIGNWSRKVPALKLLGPVEPSESLSLRQLIEIGQQSTQFPPITRAIVVISMSWICRGKRLSKHNRQAN